MSKQIAFGSYVCEQNIIESCLYLTASAAIIIASIELFAVGTESSCELKQDELEQTESDTQVRMKQGMKRGMMIKRMQMKIII